MKLGLLRALTFDSELRLGINWYLAPDEAHNADGKHISYLERSNAQHTSLKACDADLMVCLAKLVKTERSVAALEASGVLPSSTILYAARLANSDFDRGAWHAGALDALASADIVFVDPDNGIRAERRGTKPSKFAFIDELMDYVDRGQSLVVYHHADRSPGGVPVQVAKRLNELALASSIEPLGAVIARRGSTRFFFVLATHRHVDQLASSLAAYAALWHAHAEFMAFER